MRIYTLTDTATGHTARVQENDVPEFVIIDGWNMGHITGEICFPNLDTARTYIAGKWNVPRREVVLTHFVDVAPVLSIDERIVKITRQYWRRILTCDEMLNAFSILNAEEWEQAYQGEELLRAYEGPMATFMENYLGKDEDK